MFEVKIYTSNDAFKSESKDAFMDNYALADELEKSCAQSRPKSHADIAMDVSLIATEISLGNGKPNKQNLYHAHD